MEKDMTAAIRTVKRKVSQEEWRRRIEECRSSGMSVQKWCIEKGISPGSYYAHLREIREEILEEQQLVPIEAPESMEAKTIRIEAEGIIVSLPAEAGREQIQAAISALKPC